MVTTRLSEYYSIDSLEYERALRHRRNTIRRKRELKKHLYMFLFGIIIVLFLSISYTSIISNATDSVDNVSYKYYTSIKIESGDTLWSLANEYSDSEHYNSTQDYIKEVMQINHLKDSNIKAGNYIILPYYSTEFVLIEE